MKLVQKEHKRMAKTINNNDSAEEEERFKPKAKPKSFKRSYKNS